MPRKLKVFRTPIGFHDAYVAAPSRKAALAAWGADVDLFARGTAEEVGDAALGEEALAKPGIVIRRLRGSDDEHLAALAEQGASAKPKKGTSAAATRPRSQARKPKARPKPSRDKLTEAELQLDALLRDQEDALAAIRERERALQDERRELEKQQEEKRTKAEMKVRNLRDRYEEALRRA